MARRISQEFQSHRLRPNEPIVKHISVDTAVQLRQYNVKWDTGNPNHPHSIRVNDTVNRSLENRTHFIFYRDSTKCNVYVDEANNIDIAVNEICNLYRDIL